MITVLVAKNGEQIQRISITGHSGYAPKGQDIYCAAVSAVFQGAINCLTDSDESYEVKIKSGFGTLQVKKSISKHDELVLQVLIHELKDLADQNSEYITYSEGIK